MIEQVFFYALVSMKMLGAGLEPARANAQGILSPLCLPFHHPSEVNPAHYGRGIGWKGLPTPPKTDLNYLAL
jgi:hypothetical protein